MTKTVRELQDPKYTLVLNRQNIKLALASVGLTGFYGFLLVALDDSGTEYAEIWGATEEDRYVPYFEVKMELVYCAEEAEQIAEEIKAAQMFMGL